MAQSWLCLSPQAKFIVPVVGQNVEECMKKFVGVHRNMLRPLFGGPREGRAPCARRGAEPLRLLCRRVRRPSAVGRRPLRAAVPPPPVYHTDCRRGAPRSPVATGRRGRGGRRARVATVLGDRDTPSPHRGRRVAAAAWRRPRYVLRWGRLTFLSTLQTLQRVKKSPKVPSTKSSVHTIL